MSTPADYLTIPERGGPLPSLLALEAVSKSFPGVRALHQVDLALSAGRGHALVGENGAGKSTLIKVMAGLLQPDEGRIIIDGTARTLRTPSDAHSHGIALVPQEISLVPHQSIAENIYMGHLPARAGDVRRRTLRARSGEILERLGVSADPGAQLGHQPPAVQQMVMIARGVALNGRIFILDEPTASLTDPEIERLFAVIRDLKAQGAAVVYVSHRLTELKEIADDVTVLRDGEVVTHMDAATATEEQLVRAMIGRSVDRFFVHGDAARIRAEERLEVRSLHRKDLFDDISFSIKAGEVVGMAGLVGAGRTEVARTIYGLDRPDSGEVLVDGKRTRVRSPRGGINSGIVLVPEERKAQGLVLDATISDNIVLPHLQELSIGGWLRNGRLRRYSEKTAKEVGVKAPSTAVRVRTLSGGNQQKVVLGRWLSKDYPVYIFDEPTRGIDVGSKAEIYTLIERLARQGAAVLVISSELPELLGICDRILVMRAGRLVGQQDASAASEESILALAMGTDAA